MSAAFAFPSQTYHCLAAEVKMDTQILLGDQSRINRALSGLTLVVKNCQCRGTIFRSVWFRLELVLGIYLTHDGCFFFAWMDRQSRKCSECGEPLCLELLRLFRLWTSRACGQVVSVCIWSSISGCFVAIFSQIFICVELPILEVDPFQYHVIPLGPLQTTDGTLSLSNATFSFK
jgi:hypothetical protein